MLQLGNSLSCFELVAETEKYICLCFCKVAKSENFLKLNVDQLINIIRSDDINVSSEENIFESCIKWIKSIWCCMYC